MPSLQGGVFAAPDPALVGAFNGRYRAAYGESPHELAGLAYDGIAAVGAMIAQAKAQGGSPFSSARLTQPAGFAGVNGPFRFLPSGLGAAQPRHHRGDRQPGGGRRIRREVV